MNMVAIGAMLLKEWEFALNTKHDLTACVRKLGQLPQTHPKFALIRDLQLSLEKHILINSHYIL